MTPLDEIRAQAEAMLNITDDIPPSKAQGDRFARALLAMLPVVERAVALADAMDAWDVAARAAVGRAGEPWAVYERCKEAYYATITATEQSARATARQAEEENARLRERVKTLETEAKGHRAATEPRVRAILAHMTRPRCPRCGWLGEVGQGAAADDAACIAHAETCPKNPRRAIEAERDAALARAEKAEAAQAETFKAAMDSINQKAPPPSASAGTSPATGLDFIPASMAICAAMHPTPDKMGCIGALEIAAILREHFPSASAGTGGEAIGDEELGDEIMGAYDECEGSHGESKLMMARRAKELLGGSRAVKVKLPSATVPFDVRSQGSVGYATGWQDAIIAVRERLIGRVEMENQ